MKPEDLMAYADGELTGEEQERVERELQENPQLLSDLSEFYKQRLLLAEHYMEMEAKVQEVSGRHPQLGPSARSDDVSRSSRKRSRTLHKRHAAKHNRVWALSAAACVLVAAGAYYIYRQCNKDSFGPIIADKQTIEPETVSLPRLHEPEIEALPPVPETAIIPEPETFAEKSPAPVTHETVKPDIPPVAEIPSPQEPESIAGVEPQKKPTETLAQKSLDEPPPQRSEGIYPIGRVASILGSVYYRRRSADKWFKAVGGMWLSPGDTIDTRSGMAFIDLTDTDKSSLAYLSANRRTTFRLLRGLDDTGRVLLVDMSEGEVFIDDKGLRVHAETPEGIFLSVGTRFGVKRSPGTSIVSVEKGAVRAHAKAKEVGAEKPGAHDDTDIVDLRNPAHAGQAVVIETGCQSRIQKGVSPKKPYRIIPQNLAAWRHVFKQPYETILSFDFEDGKYPELFTAGEVAEEPQRPGNRYCLRAIPSDTYPDNAQVCVDRGGAAAFTYTKDLLLTFDYYWVAKASRIRMQIWNYAQRQYYKIQFNPLHYGVWTHATVRFDDLLPYEDKARRFEEGDGLGRVTIYTNGLAPFYIDNLEVVHTREP